MVVIDTHYDEIVRQFEMHLLILLDLFQLSLFDILLTPLLFFTLLGVNLLRVVIWFQS